MDKNILIIGHGIVGRNIEQELTIFDPDIIDKYKPAENKIKAGGPYDIAFICVDTPKTEESNCDITEVRRAIQDNEADIYVVKSTVLPGTTETLRSETGKRIIFSPEYYGSTQHCNNFEFPFTILGGMKEDCIAVEQLLMYVYDGRHTFHITDSKTAEYAKYMENCFLATKTSFCQQFFEIAEKDGVDYEELRELFILDPRVGESHTFVYRDKPYWDSHCLNKDVPAIAEEKDAELLKAVCEFNDHMKEYSESKDR